MEKQDVIDELESLAETAGVEVVGNIYQDNKLIYLPEEDVMLITDNKISIIGNSKYMIFKDGKYFYHNFANIKKDINCKVLFII